MENRKQQELSEWVQKQTALLDPLVEWQPDTRAALARQHARMEAGTGRTSWRAWLFWAAATTLACALVFLLPEARAWAQQLWQFLTVGRVAVIRVNPWPAGVPSPQIKLRGLPIPPLAVSNLDEARWRVGYAPRLPNPGVLTGSPQLFTTGAWSLDTVVKNADLELALEKAGVRDLSVPAQWDGAKLALHTSPIVIAEWPGVILAQSLPLTITAPPGFDFPAFSATVLRILGVGADQAKQLAERMATTPVWLVPIDSEMAQGKTIREINVRSGPATLIQDTDKNGARVTITWSVADRVYVLSGSLNESVAIAAANAVE